MFIIETDKQTHSIVPAYVLVHRNIVFSREKDKVQKNMRLVRTSERPVLGSVYISNQFTSLNQSIRILK